MAHRILLILGLFGFYIIDIFEELFKLIYALKTNNTNPINWVGK